METDYFHKLQLLQKHSKYNLNPKINKDAKSLKSNLVN